MTERLGPAFRSLLWTIFLALLLFTTAAPLYATGTPYNLSPPNGSTVGSTAIQFSWSAPSATTTAYAFYAETDEGWYVEGANWGSGPSFLAYDIPDDGQIWYWGVAAYDPQQGGWGNYTTEIWVKNGPSAVPAGPTLSLPINASRQDLTNITFKWNTGARTHSTLLEVATDTIFSGGPSGSTIVSYRLWPNLDPECVINSYLSSTCTATISGFERLGQTLHWRVTDENELGINPPPWTVRNFVNGNKPSNPSGRTPTGGVGTPGTVVPFQWSPTNLTLDYHLQIYDSTITRIYEEFTEDTHVDLEGFLEKGASYSWTVSARNYAGESVSPPTNTFVNRIVACIPALGSGNGWVLPTSRPHLDSCQVTSNSRPNYYLQDRSRQSGFSGGHTHNGRMPSTSIIQTWNYVSAGVAETAADIRPNGGESSADNVFNDSTQRFPVDAHYYAGTVYDYLNLTHNLNSFDNLGASMLSVVEVPGPLNAGYGNGSVSYTVKGVAPAPYSGTLDVVGHEWGHGVTERASHRDPETPPWGGGATTTLWYAYESGALNEAFSDWLGTTVEWANGEQNWTLAEGSFIIRDMQNPLLYNQPDRYLGPGYLAYTPANCTPPENDNCGVHTNSGVPNKMFYLLAAGGTHYNVDVVGIGVVDAFKIAMKANRESWTNDATFQEALTGMVAAANALFPGNPNPANQVMNAWAAVGIGTTPLITTASSPTAGGTVSGGGSYSFGETAIVIATANSGYQFVNWTENGLVVSTNSTYSFTANGNRTLVANFASYVPNITVTPTSFAFGTFDVGETSQQQTFLAVNGGTAPLIMGSVTLGGANPADFDVMLDSCSNFTIALNNSCEMRVRFQPLTPGAKSATLSFPSNDPDTPTVNVTLTGAVETIQQTLVELPNTDAGPNQGAPTPVGSHYVTVDDDPHDGDSTVLSFATGNSKEVFTLADQLLDTDTILDVNVRWAAKKGSGSDWDAKAGLVVGGTEYYGPQVSLSSGYVVREEPFQNNPATTQPWTVSQLRAAKLIYQQVTATTELPKAKLSEIVLVVTVQRLPLVTLSAAPAGGGTVSGGGSYPYGTSVMVTAVPNPTYAFVNWTENGNVVSTSANYTFAINDSRNLVANFALILPDISVSPTSYGFGSYAVGASSSTQTFTITNVGNAPLSTGDISTTGGHPADFVIVSDNCIAPALQPSQSCTVDVKFAPRATGSRSASLSIISDDPDTPLLTVPLSGSAQVVQYDLVEYPNSDAGPNQGSPTPVGSHYLNVDEDPHDGDTSILSFPSAPYKEVFTVGDKLMDNDVITSVKVRWMAKKGSGITWQAKAGVVVGGTEYYGPQVALSNGYVLRESVFQNNPATGQPWTVQQVRGTKVIYQQVSITTELPRASLTQINLVVSIRRQPAVSTLTEMPNSDAGPNQGAPTPVVAHYLNVDDNPHDGDTSILGFVSAGSKEVFTVADQLLDTDIITDVKVRWTAKKGSGDDWQGMAGVVVGGQEYYGPTIQLPQNYTVREDSFTYNPATNQPWTVSELRAAKVIYQQVTTTTELPRAALTQIGLVITVQRLPFAATVVMKPVTDAGPNQGSPSPSGGAGHWAYVDEDPHDSDSSVLQFTSEGNKEAFTTLDQLFDNDVVQNVRVRWVAKKGSGSGWEGKAGVVVGGTEYYGSTVLLTTPYVVREVTFANNPATGQPWTVAEVRSAKLIYQQVAIVTQLPKAKLTALVLVVDVGRAP